jgi:hypothetical protein
MMSLRHFQELKLAGRTRSTAARLARAFQFPLGTHHASRRVGHLNRDARIPQVTKNILDILRAPAGIKLNFLIYKSSWQIRLAHKVYKTKHMVLSS